MVRLFMTNKQVLLERMIHESIFFKQEYSYFLVNGEPHFQIKEYYNNFNIIKFDNGVIYIEMNSDSSLIHYEDLIEITGNPMFRIENIYNGKITNPGLIIEGSDGVGKTTISKNLLLEDGIISYDRNVPMISRHVSNDISMDVRYRIIRNYVQSTSFSIFILYASNEIELLQRITRKSRISEYDSKAVDTNNKYIYIGKKLMTEFDNVYMIDTTINTKEQTKKYIKRIIKGE